MTDPEERQSLLRRVAEIAEGKLFDQVAAFEWWARAVQENPASEQALDELLRLARVTHQWDGYVSTMLRRRRTPATRRSSGTCSCAWPRVFESDLGELQRAEEVLGQILEEQPQDGAALAFLDRIHDKQGNFEQLAEVLRRRIAITDDSKELVGLHLRLGKVLAEVLDDSAGAIASYNAVLEQESRSARRSRRWSSSTSATSAGKTLRRLREDDRHRPGRRGAVRLLRAHGQDHLRRLRRAGEGGRAVAEGARSAGGRSGGPVGPGRPARAGRRVA